MWISGFSDDASNMWPYSIALRTEERAARRNRLQLNDSPQGSVNWTSLNSAFFGVLNKCVMRSNFIASPHENYYSIRARATLMQTRTFGLPSARTPGLTKWEKCVWKRCTPFEGVGSMCNRTRINGRALLTIGLSGGCAMSRVANMSSDETESSSESQSVCCLSASVFSR